MTEYEIDKIAKKQAKYVLEGIKNDPELLDLMFPPRYMTIDEVSERFKIKKRTIYEKIDEIPHTKPAKALIFNERAFMRWVERKL